MVDFRAVAGSLETDVEREPLMQKDLRIEASGGGDFAAFAAYPDTDLPAPGVIVIQEIFGVNANVRNICENLAQTGYIAVAPDLFWRMQPDVQLDDKKEKDWQKALEFFNAFDVNAGVEDLKATLSFLRKDKDCTGKVGTVGYCLGGKLAYLMAARSDADCNVSYYGVGIQDLLEEAKNIKKPLLMHMAEKDRFVPFEAQQKIRAALNKHPQVEVDLYQGVDHAFARRGGAHYDKEAAHQANYRTADFLATYLAAKK